MEAYCESIENRSDVRATFVDFEEQKVYYTCLKNVLGQWENNHWTFQLGEESNELPSLDDLEPEILYN